jgi:condensation domain-containing protein
MNRAGPATDGLRSLTPLERRFFRAPNCCVIVALQIEGYVDPAALQVAIDTVQTRHRLLQTRTVVDDNGNAWFTTEGVARIELSTVERHSDQQWLQASLDMQKIPFRTASHPPIVFRLLHALDRSDLIISCHHMICDGLSLTYLARDIVKSLAHPGRAVAPLGDQLPAHRANIAASVELDQQRLSAIQGANAAWETQRVLFSENDYQDLFASYWENYTFDARTITLSRTQTSRLLERCKRERVTANTGLLALLLHTQYQVQGDAEDFLRRTGVAVSTRRFLLHHPGEAVGLYAAGAMFDFPCNSGNSLWTFARKLHKAIAVSASGDNILKGLAYADSIDPTLLDAVQMKRFGKWIGPDASGYQKIQDFCRRDDVIATMERNRALNAKRGVLLTNLAQVNFPAQQGGLNVEKLFFYPGTSDIFEKAFGAVTYNGCLNLLLSSIRECIDESTVSEYVAMFESIIAREFGS